MRTRFEEGDPTIAPLHDQDKYHYYVSYKSTDNHQQQQQEELPVERSTDDDEEDEEASFIHEHNIKHFKTKLEKQKTHTLGEIKEMLRQNIDINPLKFWEKDPVVCELKLHDMNSICHVKAIPQYKEEDQKEFRKDIADLLKKGLVKPSNSPHHAPAFYVRNHAEEVRGKARMVIDYRDVNKKTVKDGYQIAHARVLINRLRGAKVFSKFDAKSGFWQVKMHPDSIPLTAFGTPHGHYEWLVMPFGLKQAPSIFQRKMDNIFKHVADFCVVYIDDILVFSKSKEEHMNHLYEVAKLIVQHGIILGEKKVFLVLDEIDFLGINIRNGVIKLQPHILEKVWKFPDRIPDAKSLQRFLGVINYGRDFLPKVAGLTAILSPKTSSKRAWKFTEDDEKIIRQIKELCKNLPPLHQPEENDEIILQTDASDNFWAGVVLAKEPGTNSEKILKFCSGKFNPAEQNYPTGEKEILAIKKTIENSPAFLGKPFLVRTDCARVKNFKNFKLDKAADRGRLANWQLFLNQYDYNVELIAGNRNYLPDALTREMAMFRRNERDDEGRNPRNRRPGKEPEQPEEPMEKILKNFLLCPKRPAPTDQSQGKGLASPSQTADGKGLSRPLMAAALPKSRIFPTGYINIFKQKLNTFSDSVFQTDRNLASQQKALLDNLMFAFQEQDKRLMEKTMNALAEELAQKKKQPSASEPAVQFIKTPESARVPIQALKESEWFKFHNTIGRHWSSAGLQDTLFAVPGPFKGKYEVNVQAEHQQEHKLWLVENGFVHNLWTKTNEDLKGLPYIICNTVKNVRRSNCILRLKFRSTPPEWVQKSSGEKEYIPPYHYVRIIQGPYLEPACSGYNGAPNSSIPWMKAMSLEYIKKIIEEDQEITLLASGEKIIVATYDHPEVVTSDTFVALKRREIDASLICTQWLEKIEKDNHYQMYADTDMEDNVTRQGLEDKEPYLGYNSEDYDDM